MDLQIPLRGKHVYIRKNGQKVSVSSSEIKSICGDSRINCNPKLVHHWCTWGRRYLELIPLPLDKKTLDLDVVPLTDLHLMRVQLVRLTVEDHLIILLSSQKRHHLQESRS